VVPDPHKNCGPYSPVDINHLRPLTVRIEGDKTRMKMLAAATELHHDTMGMVALDFDGNVAGGTTTNGATFKIPGFV